MSIRSVLIATLLASSTFVAAVTFDSAVPTGLDGGAKFSGRPTGTGMRRMPSGFPSRFGDDDDEGSHSMTRGSGMPTMPVPTGGFSGNENFRVAAKTGGSGKSGNRTKKSGGKGKKTKTGGRSKPTGVSGAAPTDVPASAPSDIPASVVKRQADESDDAGDEPTGARKSGTNPTGARPTGARPTGGRSGKGKAKSGSKKSGKPSGAFPTGARPSDMPEPPSGTLARRQAEATITGTADFPRPTGVRPTGVKPTGARPSGGSCGGKGNKHKGGKPSGTPTLNARQADFTGTFTGSDFAMPTGGCGGFGSGKSRNKNQNKNKSGFSTRTRGSKGKHTKTGGVSFPTDMPARAAPSAA